MALRACNISTTACPMRWEDLDEDRPGRRYCRHCDDFVHDVSELTDEEARELLRPGGQRPACLRYEVLPDGRVLTKSVAHYGLAVLFVAVLAAGALTGCTEPEEPLDLVEISMEERPGPKFDELNRNATRLDHKGDPSGEPTAPPSINRSRYIRLDIHSDAPLLKLGGSIGIDLAIDDSTRQSDDRSE